MVPWIIFLLLYNISYRRDANSDIKFRRLDVTRRGYRDPTPRTPFLPSMRFFRPWKNEGNFMLKNERLVRLHVRFEKHSEAHSTDTGSDLFEKIGHSEAALGWKMACTKCEHDLNVSINKQYQTARGKKLRKARVPARFSVLSSCSSVCSSLVQSVSDNSSTTKSRSSRASSFRRETRSGYGDPRSISSRIPSRCLRLCADREAAQSRSVLWSQSRLACYRAEAFRPFMNEGSHSPTHNVIN